MNEKVDQYIDKQKSPQKEICTKLREIILKNYPDLIEEMKWGVPSYLGEDDGEKYPKYYFVALKDKVHLGFSNKGLSEEDIQQFDGTGKETVHIKFRFIEDIIEENIIPLMKLIR